MKIALTLGTTALAISVSFIAHAAPPTVSPGPSTPVQVTNTTSNPVPVSVVPPAIEPEEQINVCGESQGGNPIKLLYSVPADKRLVIDFASVTSSRFLEDGEALYVFIATTAQTVVGKYLAGSVRGEKGLADSRLMKLFADPGTTVTTSQASSSSSPFPHGEICVSGRLLPI